MKRLLAVVAVLVLIVLALFSIAHLRVPDREVPVDPATPIHLADGRVVPLAEVIEVARLEVPQRELGANASNEPESSAEGTTTNEEAIRATLGQAATRSTSRSPSPDPLFSLAQVALKAGRHDEALALYLSVPRNSPEYARARRRAGWDVLTKRQGNPHEGAQYVEEAVRLEPLKGNSWQDLSRVYAASYGIAID